MPQITVTIEEETYMNLTHFLPKGMKSKFVNMAVSQAMYDCSIPAGNAYGLPSQVLGNVVHRYAREGPDAAMDLLMLEMKRLAARRQAFPFEFEGAEEE